MPRELLVAMMSRFARLVKRRRFVEAAVLLEECGLSREQAAKLVAESRR